ncbi:MAG: IS66 family transposase [Pseudomonadota bacterium]|nr:IS66 family transposase [Pseudomonadota bacterium]
MTAPAAELPPLPQDPEALQALVRAQARELALVRAQLAWFTEQYRLSRLQRFGPSRERVDERQLRLFEDPPGLEPPPAADLPPPPASRLRRARRVHTGGGRGPLPAHLPRERIVHDLPEADRACPCCGQARQVIGQERSEQLDIHPPRLVVLEQVRLKYACRHCQGHIQTPPPAAQPIARSFVSPGLLAWLVVAKYADGLPLYRLVKILARWGVVLSRTTLSHWMIQAGQLVQPLINLLHEQLLEADIVQADETPLQVLREAGRAAQTKSFLWLYRSGTSPPIVLYDYQPTRAGAHPKRYLAGFGGYLQTDGYPGYGQVGETGHRPTLVGCWAHVRRYFLEALQALPPGTAPGLAGEALYRIGRLYRIERLIKTLSPEQRRRYRQRLSQPRLEALHDWLQARAGQVLPKSLLGKAVGYALNQWPRLIRYVEDGRLSIDNNASERDIKTVVIGRKAWLFCNTPAGARASANLYALVETAKANGLEPWAYLKGVFRDLPRAQSVEQIEALLPWNVAAEAGANDHPHTPARAA